MNFKDVEVEGVTIRLYKLDVFKAKHILIECAPLLTSLAPLAKGGNADIKGAFDDLVSKLNEAKHDEIIFNGLLNSDHVKIVINGAEMPLIGKGDNGTRAIMNDNLNDLFVLYEIAYKSLQYNFENFFKKGLNMTAIKI